jgi:hypothetical protein
MLSFLNPGDIAYDVGANFGLYPSPWRRECLGETLGNRAASLSAVRFILTSFPRD